MLKIKYKYGFLKYAMLFLLHSVVFFILLTMDCNSEENEYNSISIDYFKISDDQKNDTLSPQYQIADSLSFTTNDSLTNQVKDTVVLYLPLKIHGKSINLSNDTLNIIGKKDLQLLEYHSFAEMLYKSTPSYPLYLGMPGMFNSASFFGSNSVSYGYNNRPLIDNEYGNYNQEKLSTEFFENVEMLYGSDAVILKDNNNGAAVNIQEIKYNTRLPYTKLWYSQDSEELISADGIFSQNFAPNFNYTFGFRRLAGNGQFDNSTIDLWNVRNMLRWNPSQSLHLSLTHYFTNHGTGLNGGIDERITNIQEYFSNNNNPVYFYYSDLKQRTFSHDLTLSGTAILDNDTTSVVSANLFLSHNENTFQLSTNLLNLTGDSTFKHKYMGKYYGGNLFYEQELLNFTTLKTGAEFYFADNEASFLYPEISTTSFSAFARLNLDIFSYVNLSGGIRYRNYNEHSLIATGAKAKLNFQSLGLVSFDLSLSQLMPNILFSNFNNENHLLAIAEYNLSLTKFNLRLGGYLRNILNPISYKYDSVLTAEQDDNETIYGAYAMFMLNPFKNYYFESSLTSNVNTSSSKNYLPPLSARIRTYYTIYAGRSIMNLGLEGSLFLSHTGKKYMPLYRLFVENDYESGFMYDGLKVFATAKLGDTFIKVSFENLLSSGFYYVPINPVLSRNLRVSFIWTFLD